MKKLKKSLDSALTTLCESLPLNLTLFEEKGKCNAPSDNCEHYKLKNRIHHCYKKTSIYLPLMSIR